MVEFNDGQIASGKLQKLINDLREEVGLTDAEIPEALEPHLYNVTPETMERVLQLEAQLQGSAEWRQKVLAGDAAAYRHSTGLASTSASFSRRFNSAVALCSPAVHMSGGFSFR
jgi:hypothetical protein